MRSSGIARLEWSQTYRNVKSWTANASSSVTDAAVISRPTPHAALSPLAMSSRARRRTPTRELTTAYTASAKAPTMQICPRAATLTGGVVGVLVGGRVLEARRALGQDGIGRERAMGVELALGDDLDVVAHD